MAGQSSIFDDTPSRRHRRSDPKAAKAAAESMSGPVLSGQRHRVLWALDDCIRHGLPGASAHDVMMRLAYEPGGAPQQSVIAKRCSELRDAGLIVDTGETRRGSSHRELTVWTLTDEGRGYLTREVAA